MKITFIERWFRHPKAVPGATIDVPEVDARYAIQHGIAVPADAAARTATETLQDRIAALEAQLAELTERAEALATERDAARSDIADLLKEVSDLTAQLAAAAPPATVSAEAPAEETAPAKAKKEK